MKRWLTHFSLAFVTSASDVGPSVSSFLHFDESFEFRLDDGCHYSAQVQGTLTPILTGPDAGHKVEPNLTISATLACPRTRAEHARERLSNTGPMTREQVEASISRQATLTSENDEQRCTYVPTIHFVGEGIVGVGVYATCTKPRF